MRSRLAHKLDVHPIATLHSRASAWYADHDFPEAALEHALAGHDMLTAAQLVAQHRHHLLDTEQRPRLKRWLRLFPAATLAQHPDLLLARVWVAELGQANSQTISETLDQAQLLVSQMAERPERAWQLRGEIDALRCGAMSFAANDPQEVIALATQALAALPQEWYLVRAETWLYLGVALQMLGQVDRGLAIMAAAQAEDMAVIGSPRWYVSPKEVPLFIRWLRTYQACGMRLST